MKLLPITLSVKRKAFRADTPHASASDRVYIEARKKVLSRDRHTCRFCGFRSAKNEVHHMNDDHSDHSNGNLVTACVLCHMSFHIAFAGIKGRGTIIALPSSSITQGGLNQLVRHLWIAEELGDGDLKNTASQLLSRLEKSEIQATALVGTSNASILGDYMTSLSDEDYLKRADALEGIFLMPSKAAYKSYIKTWSEEAKNFNPKQWVESARASFSEWGGND